MESSDLKHRIISEKTFFHYLKCPNWIYHKAHTDEEKMIQPLQEQLIDDGLLIEKQREVLGDRLDLIEIEIEDPEKAFEETLKAMREGHQTIFHGALLYGHWIGHPDILEKVEGKSRLGDYYYVAADIKRSRTLRNDYKFQGCFYAELLEQIQGIKPLQGYIMTPDRVLLSYLIESFETSYKLTLHEIERILAGDKPAHFLTSGCKQSPWFSICKEESQLYSDLSLLNHIWREEIALFKKCGIESVRDLATYSDAKIKKQCPFFEKERLFWLRDQAKALTSGEYIIKQAIFFKESSVELYFDIESDPLRDFDYLFGLLVNQKNKLKYHGFIAKKPEEEAKMWYTFIKCIESFPDAPIYHYGWFEREVIHRFSMRYETPESVKHSLEENMIDLLNLIRPAVIFPLSFYSLKDIATYLGFKWQHLEVAGSNSIFYFENYLETHKKKYLEEILAYNEEDVRATFHLKQWLSKHT